MRLSGCAAKQSRSIELTVTVVSGNCVCQLGWSSASNCADCRADHYGPTCQFCTAANTCSYQFLFVFSCTDRLFLVCSVGTELATVRRNKCDLRLTSSVLSATPSPGQP